jgi:GNAT superfamily N-acetyltransferase
VTLTLRDANQSDLPLLAAMNRRLIEDEGSRNPMSLDELRERVASWLAGDWRVVLFEADGACMGYAVLRECSGESAPIQPVVHVRQFFVERDYRRRGIGRCAFELLASGFAPGASVEIDVLATNPGGIAFWQRLGFETYCTTMTRACASRPGSSS